MNTNIEYIFIADGYRGANTFMFDHMEYLIKKRKVILFDHDPKNFWKIE